jgi:hypothetical protein
MPAGYAIGGSLLAVALVAAASMFGLLDKHQGGDASSFDFGATTTTAAGDPTDGGAAAGGAGAAGASTTVAPTTLPPTTVPDTNRVPTKEDPARLYIAGDSDAGNLGPPLQRSLEKTGLVTSKLFYKVSSGLTRPEFFDWPAKLQDDVSAYNPDVVVVTFGGNDAQDIKIDGRNYPVDSPQWRAEYGRRVGAVMDYLSADGRTLVWVGIPNASSDAFRARLQVLREVTEAEAEKRPKVIYVDAWKRFSGLDGSYASYVVDPRDNEGKLVRADDGFHLNVTGAEILALDVQKKIEDDLRARGAQL